MRQLTWTRLPQGFKNSLTLFNEVLSQDLEPFRWANEEITLLQYVDDLLLAAPTKESCRRTTGQLLALLGELGYRASAKKAQTCQERVTYLGYQLEGGARWLTEEMKQMVLHIPVPTSARKVREFLGSAAYCRLWIPSFAEIAKPLYEATKETQDWKWTESHQATFEHLRVALLQAPALAPLPCLTLPNHSPST